jgi:hypothetical protein
MGLLMTPARRMHRTMAMVSPFPVDIDVGIAGIIERAWARGLPTSHSCQGDPARTSGPPGGDATESLAYVRFASVTDANVFVRTAGLPLADGEVATYSKFAETCTVCGAPIDVGASTIWVPRAITVRHLKCVPLLWNELGGTVRFAHEFIGTVERNFDEPFAFDS